ncbi:CbtA family protein [Rhizobiales bacterium]|uniref:CbtA family protein n=1 Tax=Hongsoonwoonella zoysiae TaxID=2821844 RepID=UPI00156080CD|nr:CbtA family protein [Hongsoonwoonella zoysiae]NRG16244.1 CbtA family protein [Hongsoonwoonella zoysiae]
MLQRLLTIAIVAGVIAGAGATLFQLVYSVPMIEEAELYETGAAASTITAQSGTAATASGHSHDLGAFQGHAHGEDEWQPAGGLERNLYTFASNILAAVGFALLLVACLFLSGRAINAGTGALWGAAGFAAFSLAPFFGLPPELPGMTAPDLVDRQIWWVGTALSTSIGIALVAFSVRGLSRWAGIAAGTFFILAPHAVGAPELSGHAATSNVPAHLSAKFAVASLVHGAVLWVLLGVVAGWLFAKRFGDYGDGKPQGA